MKVETFTVKFDSIYDALSFLVAYSIIPKAHWPKVPLSFMDYAQFIDHDVSFTREEKQAMKNAAKEFIKIHIHEI